MYVYIANFASDRPICCIVHLGSKIKFLLLLLLPTESLVIIDLVCKPWVPGLSWISMPFESTTTSASLESSCSCSLSPMTLTLHSTSVKRRYRVCSGTRPSSTSCTDLQSQWYPGCVIGNINLKNPTQDEQVNMHPELIILLRDFKPWCINYNED